MVNRALSNVQSTAPHSNGRVGRGDFRLAKLGIHPLQTLDVVLCKLEEFPYKRQTDIFKTKLKASSKLGEG